MQWCHTDLGANVFRISRLLREDRRFGVQGAAAGGLGAEHYDGALANSILDEGMCPFHSLMSRCYITMEPVR